MKIALFLLFVAACVVGQAQNPGDIELLIIDEFVLGQNVQSVEVIATTAIVSGQDPPLSTTDSFNAGSGCSGLLGCVRDLSIEVTQSLQGRSYTADVLPGQIAVATAKGGQTNLVVQYDSVPGFTSPPASAMSINLTGGNSSPYFFFSILSDLNSTLLIDVRDTQAQLCNHTLPVTGIEGAYQLEDTYYYVDFQSASFSSCDMTQISSVQLRMSYFDAVDIIIYKFSVYGPVPATPTATQTPAPPTPTISGSALSNATSLSTSASLSITPSLSVTPTLSTTASLSVTPTLSTTPTRTIAPSPSGSASRSSTATPSVSPIRIQTASRTPAASPSSSITPTASASKSTGATPSRTPSASPLCGSCPRASQVVESVEEPVAVTVGTIEVVAPPGSLRVGETLIVVNAGNSQSQNVPLPPGEISGDVVIIDLIDENGNEVQPSGPIEICITPGSNPPDDLCLAFQSNGAWLCVDDSPVLTNGQYCGVTNHFTIFALVSKSSIPEPIGPAPGDRSSFSFGDSSTTYAFPTSFFNTFQTNAFTSAFGSSPSDSSDGVSMVSFLSVGVVTLFLVALC